MIGVMKHSNLGKLLKTEREKRGWEQADLAAMLKRGQQTISRWEKGNSRPRQDDLLKLAKIFSGDEDVWLTIADYQPEAPDISLAPFLPIFNLTPENFELFSRDLVQAIHPTASVHRYGVPGNDQEGIDLYADHSDKKVFDYQCKRHKQFGPADIDEAVKTTTLKANKHYLLLTRRATADARKAIRKHKNWDLWDLEDVAAEIRRLPQDDALRIVDTYFPGWRKKFLGKDDPSPWLPPEDFFSPLMSKLKIFSHGWSFVGRKKEIESLQDFCKQDDLRAIILSGRGGIGKSRLLREWTSKLPRPTKVVFLSERIEVSPQDYGFLPKGPAYLVIDDVHDRADMLTILSSIARTRPEIKLVLSTRPYGVTRLQDEMVQSGVTFDRDQSINLDDLTVEDAKNLSEEILTAVNGDKNYAQRIAEITKDCPLATVVGSQLVGKGQIKPEVLNNDEEFRQQLMRSFRNIVAGQIGTSNPEAVRDLLNLISLIQPINSLDPHFQQLAEKLLGQKNDHILRNINALEDAGVLLKRGSKSRIVPDLLADYIRTDVSYDEKNSRPTGYADKVFDNAQNELATNLLVNISQLDWRLSSSGVQASLLAEVWANLKEQFRKAKIYERSSILTALEKIAYYQPEQVLEFVRIALEEPIDEIEDQYKQYSFTDPSYRVVTEKIAPVLKYVAYHQDYLHEALELLRRLAGQDKRTTNPHPNHPLRVLQDIASIEPGKPVVYNQAVADQVISWLNDVPSPNFSPFDVLDQLLQTEGHTSETKGITITMKAFKVRPEAVAGLRKQVIDAAFDEVTTKPLKEGLRAMKSISAALSFPRGLLGQQITSSDVAAWEPGILEILTKLEGVVTDKKIDPYIATEVRSAVSWHSTYSKTSTKVAAKKVLATIPTTLPYEVSRAIVDGWGWTFEREGENYKRDEAALIKWRDKLAKRLVSKYKEDFPSLTRFIEERIETIRNSSTSRHPEPGYFISALMEVSADYASFLGDYLLDKPDSPLAQWLNAVIFATAKTDNNRAIKLMQAAVKKKNETLTQCVARTIGWVLYDKPISDQEIELLRQLAQSEDAWVRKSIVRAVQRFSPEQKQLALEILLSIKIIDSKEVADEVLGEFDDKHGKFKVGDLSNEQLKILLASLIECKSIDDYHIELFLNKLSLAKPKETAKLLMNRVEFKEANPELKEYDPIPFSWNRNEPIRFNEAKEYEWLLREIRDWATVKTDSWIRFHYGSDLFKLVSAGFDEVTLKVLDEWTSSSDERQLIAAATLLGEAPRNFVWDKQQFITKILDHAQKFGDKCYRRIASALHSSVLQGGKSGTPGQPFPEDIEQRDKAYEMMQKLPAGSPTHRFYKSLYEEAVSEIDRHTNEDFEFE